MRKIARKDVLSLEAYEKRRARVRRDAIARKARRRVEIPPTISIVFENRETALYQIQEMLRAERIVKPSAIRHEIDTYNELVPELGSLRATLLIELTDPPRFKEDLQRFVGLPGGGHVFLEIGGRRVDAIFDDRQFGPERISAVQYLSFVLSPEDVAAMRRRGASAAVVCTHPANPGRAAIPAATRSELISDLAGAAPRGR